MRAPNAPQEGLCLLGSISARLDTFGVPEIEHTTQTSTAPTFTSLRREIVERIAIAAEAGFDIRPAFEIDERRIGVAASSLTQRWYDLNGNLPDGDLPWLHRRPDPSSLHPRRWFKKELLRRERQITDFFYHTWQAVGGSQMPVVSDAVLASKQRQNEAAQKFAERHEFRAEIAELQTAIPFIDVAASAGRRAAKLYVRGLGLEKYCTQIGLKGFFVTLTLPGQYHPNPSAGQNTWMGVTPTESHNELQRRWRQFQREFGRKCGKARGVRVEEPHRDGCPHWHLLVYVDPAKEATLREIFGRFFGNETAAKVVQIDPAKGTGASYLMKYILPAINANGDTQAARYQAHRAVWGKRAIQFFDSPGSSTIWDELRRIKPDSQSFKNLTGFAKQMHKAACSNDYCEFLFLMDQNVDKAASDPALKKNTKRVRIWYSENDASSSNVSTPRLNTSNKVQGLIDCAKHVDTHPHSWSIYEKKNIRIAKDFLEIVLRSTRTIPPGTNSPATVTHSYPSKYGNCNSLALNVQRTPTGGWHPVTKVRTPNRSRIVSDVAMRDWERPMQLFAPLRLDRFHGPFGSRGP